MICETMPAEFRMFMRSRPRECYKALFEAAKETLFALAKDPKYIGYPNIGATGVLHTWGRDLNYHPHLHFIVPGGATGFDGKSWLSSRVDFLIPVLAASLGMESGLGVSVVSDTIADIMIVRTLTSRCYTIAGQKRVHAQRYYCRTGQCRIKTG